MTLGCPRASQHVGKIGFWHPKKEDTVCYLCRQHSVADGLTPAAAVKKVEVVFAPTRREVFSPE